MKYAPGYTGPVKAAGGRTKPRLNAGPKPAVMPKTGMAKGGAMMKKPAPKGKK